MGLATSGILTERMTLRVPTRVSNGSGGWTNTYSDVGEINGRYCIPDLRRIERYRGESPQGTEFTELYLDRREFETLREHRVLIPDGREFEIVAVEHQGDIAFAVGRRI